MLVKILNTPLITIVTKSSISDITVILLDKSLEQVSLAALLQTPPTILYSNGFSNFRPCIFSENYLTFSARSPLFKKALFGGHFLVYVFIIYI